MQISKIVATLAIIFSGVARAEYVPAPWPEDSPVFESATFVRAGLTVRDIDESLKFYRDVLGMKVLVDRSGMFDPRLPMFSGIDPEQTIRLTILRSDTNIAHKLNAGYIALSEISDAHGVRIEPEDNVVATGLQPGSIMLQFTVDDVRPIHQQVIELGYEVISEPVERPDGSRSELLVRDHNGIRFWITDRYTRSVFLWEIADEES